ncbi:MAG: LptA/OstA family protein [Candidatus Electryonea clarkiae]|nr:LptA/OstA family protein [Candidatus Electryonea clarkiae]MDP8289038.1 LptA/OstA family protein [Candidatus Electryonea clarkiae]
MKRASKNIHVLIIILIAVAAAFSSPIAKRGKLTNRGTKKAAATKKIKNERNPDYGDFQGQGRDTQGAVRLLRAAELSQRDDRIGQLSVLNRDVKIIQDSMTVWCDKAKYRKNIGKLELIKNVLMIDTERRLEADRVTYFEKSRKTIAQGNVKVTRDSTILSSWRGEYEEHLEIVHINRDMVIEDLKHDVILTGDEGTYERLRERAKVPVNPVLVQLDSLDEEKARITGKMMLYEGEAGIAEVHEDVTITWGKVRGTSELLFYYSDDSKALLLGNPVVWQDRDEVSGDSIWIYLVDDVLDSVEVIGNAIAYTIADTAEVVDENVPRNKMTGQRIIMDFDDGHVIRMQSQTQTIAIYHLFEDGKDEGSNKVSGDQITLSFKDGELNDIEVIGGTRGTYFPTQLAKKVREDE